MNRIRAVWFPALSLFILGFSACQKSEPGQPKAEAENAQPAPAAKKAAPVIPPGTWIGTIENGSIAATLTVEPANRLTVTQQDSPISGTYAIDDSVSPFILTFTPDENPAKHYTSQVQWVDDKTINMTSLVEAAPTPGTPIVAPPAAPVAPPVENTQAPFTGNVPSPKPLVNPPATPSSDPDPDPVVVTITFRLQ